MRDDVIVIGSGPAGLACAAELIGRGVSAAVLEEGEQIAAAWAGRYDSMRFNTSRLHSALPGAPFPRPWGQFPTRDQYVGYLHEYARQHSVPVHTAVHADRVVRADDQWCVQSSTGPWHARHVIVATGAFNRPRLPGWFTETGFAGRVLHSADYHHAAEFVGRDVVVVGAGSTGMEIAAEVARGGAKSVSLSVRTPPNILLRIMGGTPSDLPVPIFLHLPTAVVDRMLAMMQRWFIGDLSDYGLPAATEGVMAGLKRRGSGTAIVDPEVIEAIRTGLVRIVGEVNGLDGDGVLLVGDQRLRADVVIAATGFDTGLEPLVGHLGVLDGRGLPRDGLGHEVLPGLRFVGYVPRPGITGYVGRLARRAAPEIAAQERRKGAPSPVA